MLLFHKMEPMTRVERALVLRPYPVTFILVRSQGGYIGIMPLRAKMAESGYTRNPYPSQGTSRFQDGSGAPVRFTLHSVYIYTRFLCLSR